MPYDQTEENVLKVAYDKNNVYVNVEGEATMFSASTLKKFVVDIVAQFAAQSDKNIYLILNDCKYMDSTFIGTLIVLEKHCIENIKKHVLLYNPSAYCIDVFEQVGLLKLFTIITEPSLVDKLKFEPLLLREIDRLENAVLMFQAHEELSNVNEENKERFALVTKALKAEINKEMQKK